MLGNSRPGWDQLLPHIVDSWSQFWIYLLLSGALSAVFVWWIGGWWYRVRLRWCGARAPDPWRARLLLVYSSFVFSGPLVLALLVETTLYPSYREAFEQAVVPDMLVLICLIWSVFTSYRGVRTLFDVSPIRAGIWFAALPLFIYLVALGAWATIFAFLGELPDPTGSGP